MYGFLSVIALIKIKGTIVALLRLAQVQSTKYGQVAYH